MTKWQKCKRGAIWFWRNVRSRGIRRALRIFWSNFWRDHTHYMDTAVPYGRWSDMRGRLSWVLENGFLRFLEGEYRQFHNHLAEDPPTGSVQEQVVAHLQWETEVDNEPQAEAAAKALEVYRYLKNERPRMESLVDRLDDRYEIDLQTDDSGRATLWVFTEERPVHADRSRKIRTEIETRNQEARKMIAEIIPWMWT